MRNALLLTIVALASGGCSLILDEKVAGFEPNLVPDVVVDLIGFEAHVSERVELSLISDEGFVQGHAVVDTMPDLDFTIMLEDAYMVGVDRIDFWADNDNSGGLTAPMPDPLNPGRTRFPDHMWRVDELPSNGHLEFMHNTDFTDITTERPAQTVAGPFALSVTGAGDFTGESAEVLVYRNDTNVQVGSYFLSEIENGTIEAALVGIIEDEVVYTVNIDLGDESRCAEFNGLATGLTIDTELGEFAECAQ